MADKSIEELNPASTINANDSFVLSQNGAAMRLTGQVLINWLTKMADGHGGIASITKTGTSGVVDTYTITLADTTTFSFNVTNGAKGDPGDNGNVWIKYASQMPTDASHSMGDIPDMWIGISSGHDDTAPTDWKKYTWYKFKGEKGETGTPATVTSATVTYQVSTSGTVHPDGAWSTSVPTVPQGRFLWTRTVVQFNSGSPVTSYSVARMGMDGTGTVSTVCGNDPDSGGNVDVSAEDVGALPITGGTMQGAIAMGGKRITGLGAPTDNGDAATKAYVDTAKAGAISAAKEYTDGRRIVKTATISTTWTGSTAPYTQTVTVSGILATDTPHIMPVYSSTQATALAQKEAWAKVSKADAAAGSITFTCFEEKPTVDIPIQIEVIR